MHTSISKWMRLGALLVILSGMLCAGAISSPQLAAAATPPKVGIVCTSGSSPNPTFDLVTNTGHIFVGDGNTVFMWGYSLAGQPFQHPGPVLCVNEGDTVTINLHNTLAEDASIIFPGQDNVLANGELAQPQLDNLNNVTSLTNVATANGGSVTYSFVASHAGTFLYESGTNPEKQVRMGLFGALIVRPAAGANFIYNGANNQFTPEEEFLVLLSDIDPLQHQAAEEGKPYDLNNYHTHYWLINGRTFPDSVADNFASWLPNQPYGALARIHPFKDTGPTNAPDYHPYPAAARYLNVGLEDYAFHPHGNNGIVVGRDGRPYTGPGNEDLSYEKFAFNVGPGQTFDVLFKWYDAEGYNPDTHPVPVVESELPNLQYGMFYSGSPYLGEKGPMLPGASTLNVCGEFYIISHNHALFQLDAWGVTMAGQITYLRVDPPLPNSCPE